MLSLHFSDQIVDAAKHDIDAHDEDGRVATKDLQSSPEIRRDDGLVAEPPKHLSRAGGGASVGIEQQDGIISHLRCFGMERDGSSRGGRSEWRCRPRPNA